MKKQFPTIPVVVATAVHDDFAERDCIQNGAYEYLREPFERKQLLDVVHRALKFRNSK
jgi:DNA-binding NtrC family response regulator